MQEANLHAGATLAFAAHDVARDAPGFFASLPAQCQRNVCVATVQFPTPFKDRARNHKKHTRGGRGLLSQDLVAALANAMPPGRTLSPLGHSRWPAHPSSCRSLADTCKHTCNPVGARSCVYSDGQPCTPLLVERRLRGSLKVKGLIPCVGRMCLVTCV